MKRISIFVILSLLAGSLRCAAQSIVSFTFGASGSPTTSASSTATNVSASVFSGNLGSPTLTSSSPQSTTAGGSGANYFTASYFRSTDNNYFEFTVTPANGYQVTLSSVSFYYLATSSGPTSSSFQSNANSYGSNLANFSLTRAGSSPGVSDWHLANSSVSLTFSSPTTFRITGTGASAYNGSFKIDDVTLSGSVSAVPEPSTYATIAGAAAFGAAAWKRRRKG
jgi:hypothetical protein